MKTLPTERILLAKTQRWRRQEVRYWQAGLVRAKMVLRDLQVKSDYGRPLILG